MGVLFCIRFTGTGADGARPDWRVAMPARTTRRRFPHSVDPTGAKRADRRRGALVAQAVVSVRPGRAQPRAPVEDNVHATFAVVHGRAVGAAARAAAS